MYKKLDGIRNGINKISNELLVGVSKLLVKVDCGIFA